MKPIYSAYFLLTAASGLLLASEPTQAAPPSMTIPLRSWDLIVGDGRNGAYPLGWQNIQTKNGAFLEVRVGGEILGERDYKLDGGKGEITFQKRLDKGAVAYVAYTYLSQSDSKRKNLNTTATTPLTLPVTRIGSATFDLIALPKNDTADADFIWRQNGRMNLLGGAVTSQILFDPKSHWSGGDTSVVLGYRTGIDRDRYGLAADFSRVGNEFAESVGKRMSLADPTQRMAFGLRARPYDLLTLTTNLIETKNTVTENQNRLLESAIALRDRRSRWTFSVARKTDSSNPVGDSKTTGTVRDTANITLLPTQKLKITLDGNSETQHGDKQDTKTAQTQSARAELTPDKNTQITGAVNENRQPDKTTRTGEIGVTAKRGILETGANYIRRSDTLDTTKGSVTLKPNRFLSVSGAFTQNPFDNNAALDGMRHDYGISARIAFLEISSGYSLTDLRQAGQVDYGDWKLDVGLHMDAQTRLFGNYQSRFSYGALTPVGIRVYGLGLARDLGDRFNFSISGTKTEDKSAIGQPTDIKGEAKLGVKF